MAIQEHKEKNVWKQHNRHGVVDLFCGIGGLRYKLKKCVIIPMKLVE